MQVDCGCKTCGRAWKARSLDESCPWCRIAELELERDFLWKERKEAKQRGFDLEAEVERLREVMAEVASMPGAAAPIDRNYCPPPVECRNGMEDARGRPGEESQFRRHDFEEQEVDILRDADGSCS